RGQGEVEGQGVTSWSTDDLRIKYRSEEERQEAYRAFLLAKEASEAVEKGFGEVVPFAEVDQHPLYAAYEDHLERENTQCLLRASARNKMKRFVLDVHTVWLTNLSHHPEYQGLANGSTKNIGVSEGKQPPKEGDGRQTRGLDNRRDKDAILGSISQIQSVQVGRAFQGAVFYSGKGGGAPVAPTPGQLIAEVNSRQGQEEGVRDMG
ncbi:unnamed protein product, partial [Choristocarpus tenellus]